MFRSRYEGRSTARLHCGMDQHEEQRLHRQSHLRIHPQKLQREKFAHEEAGRAKHPHEKNGRENYLLESMRHGHEWYGCQHPHRERLDQEQRHDHHEQQLHLKLHSERPYQVRQHDHHELSQHQVPHLRSRYLEHWHYREQYCHGKLHHEWLHLDDDLG